MFTILLCLENNIFPFTKKLTLRQPLSFATCVSRFSVCRADLFQQTCVFTLISICWKRHTSALSLPNIKDKGCFFKSKEMSLLNISGIANQDKV